MNDLRDSIARALGVAPVRITPLTGGCIAPVFRADMPDSSALVAKVASRPGALDLEAFMLRYLAAHTTLPVPAVVHADPSLLLMQHMKGASRFTSASQEHAAALLASLHSISAPSFGLERDTLIGGLHQPNTQTASWIDFFRDHRLLHFASAAHDEGRLNLALLRRIDRLAARLPDLLTEPDRPGLIHGEVWTTNVLAADEHITAFLDPAIYFAHPEIELAFISLFGSFGRPFFEAYHHLHPIRPGFLESRRVVYNLYPLFVHVRLFGGGYAHQVSDSLERLGC